MGYNSVMTERALREVYLMPFMLAQKYAQPWAYMTAYVKKRSFLCISELFCLGTTASMAHMSQKTL